jgi:hypothetical protein
LNGWALIIGVFAMVCSGQAQLAPPFNMGQGHPDFACDIFTTDLVDVVVGLQFITRTENGQTWKGFYADGLLCLTGALPIREGSNDWVEYYWPSNPGFQWFSNPGDPPSQSHVPPHHGDVCRWFAGWSQDLASNPTRDISLEATVTLHYDPPIEGHPMMFTMCRSTSESLEGRCGLLKILWRPQRSSSCIGQTYQAGLAPPLQIRLI